MGTTKAQHNRESELYARQVAELFKFAPSAVAFSFFGSLITLGVFFDTNDFGRGLYWFAFATAVMLFRGGVCLQYAQLRGRVNDPQLWARLIIIGNFLAGVQWGLLGTVLYPSEPGYRELYSVMVIISYVAGSIVAFTPVRWAHEALALPAALPAAIYIPFFHHHEVHLWSGVMALFFVFTVLFFAARQQRAVATRLKYGLENEALLARLNDTNSQLGVKNQELKYRAEVISRSQLEARRRANILASHVERTLLPVIECDRDFRVVEWNHAAQVTLGYRFEEVRNRNLGEIVFPLERQGNIKPFVDKLLRDNQPTTVDSLATTATRQRLPVRLYVTPILTEEGTPLRIAVIVTEAYGQQEERNPTRPLSAGY
jgi:PAS domain S-box-containing protein